MGMLKQAAAPAAEPETPELDPAADPTGAPAEDPEGVAPPDPGSTAAPEGEGADGEEAAAGPTSSGEQATPEEQAEYERAFKALNTVVYGDDGTSEAIAGQLQPDDKIGSVVKASLLIIKSLDEKINLDESIVAQISQDTVGMLVDIMDRVKKAPFSDQEYQQAMGSTWEGVMELFGVEGQEFDEFAKGEAPDATKKAGEYLSKLKEPAQAAQPAAPAQPAPAAPAAPMGAPGG